MNYGAALSKLDKYISEQHDKIEEANAKGLLSQKAYNRALLTADSVAAGSRLELARDFKQDTVKLEQDAKKAQISIIKELTDEEKAEIDKRIAIAQNFGESAGKLIADSLFEQGATMQDFFGKLLILVLGTIEKQLIAQQTAAIASASIQSLSEPDSVASFGASGFARIAILTAAITAAFEIAKAGISFVTTPTKQFAQGTVLAGPSHIQGGVQLLSRSGYHYGEAEGGEAIINRKSTKLFLPVLDYINQAGGGRPLVASMPTYPLAALGAITRPVAQIQLRAGMAEGLDYNRLAQAMGKLNVYTKTQEFMQSVDNVTYTKNVLAKD